MPLEHLGFAHFLLGRLSYSLEVRRLPRFFAGFVVVRAVVLFLLEVDFVLAGVRFRAMLLPVAPTSGRIRVAWAAIVPVSLGGAVGLLAGLTWVAPLFPAPLTKIFFCCLWLSFAVALHLVSAQRKGTMTDTFSTRDSGLSVPALLGIGVLGGIVTSLVGSGIDILTFSFLTLLARLSERVATPTSVILMASNAVVGFIWQGPVRGVIAADSWSFWYVCVPVVVFGAPLGARFIRGRSSADLKGGNGNARSALQAAGKKDVPVGVIQPREERIALVIDPGSFYLTQR